MMLAFQIGPPPPSPIPPQPSSPADTVLSIVLVIWLALSLIFLVMPARWQSKVSQFLSRFRR